MPTIEIPQGDREEIIPSPEPDASFSVDVESGAADVFVSHRAQGTVREGRRLVAGDRAVLDNLRGKPVYAKPDPDSAAAARIEVQREGFDLIFQSRATQAAARQNRPSVSSQSVAVATGGTGLPAIAIPDGFSLLVQSDPGNADRIQIGDGSGGGGAVLRPGDGVTLAVQDASVVTATALGTQSQTVNLLVES